MAIVRADINATAGDDGSGVGLGAELGGPFDVVAGFGVEGVGEVALGGDHVAGPGFAPLGLVAGVGLKAAGEKEQADWKLKIEN